MDCSPQSTVGYFRLLCPWNSSGKNTTVGRHSLPQGIFPTWEANLGLLYCRHILYRLSHQGSNIGIQSVQFSLVTQLCQILCDPMNCSTPGLPVHHQLLEFTQTHAHWVSDAIQPSHPLLSPSPSAPNPSQHQGLFHWVNSSHEVANVLEFQLQPQSFQLVPAKDKKEARLGSRQCYALTW